MPSNSTGYMLSEFTLSIELDEFLNVFWMDSQVRYNKESLLQKVILKKLLFYMLVVPNVFGR